jgi:hypothetical protein
MQAMTGIEGSYDPGVFKYQPPTGYRSWEQVVEQNGLGLRLGIAFVR